MSRVMLTAVNSEGAREVSDRVKNLKIVSGKIEGERERDERES
jgi:hypothetical protein